MSQAPRRPGLLGLVSLLSHTAFAAIYRALTYPFRSRRAPTFHKDVAFAAIRTMLHYITIPQVRYLNPSTTQRYLDYCSKEAIVPHTLRAGKLDSVDGEEVVAHWIGQSDAKIIVLFLHGGGYTNPSTDGYYEYWGQAVKVFNAKGNVPSVSVLLLAYTLAPEARYPTQLQEAAAMLSHLLNHEGRSPSSIILSGDSAGGNLALSLLSHILHPHTEVTPIKLSEPLRGVLLYSPWVSFKTDFGSFSRNSETDVLIPTMLRRWAAMYLGQSNKDPETDPGVVSGDSYSEPLSNEASWWSGMHHLANEVFVVSGGDECFADGIKMFGRVFQEGWKDGGADINRNLFIEFPRRAHIDPIMSVMLAPKEKGEDQVVVEERLRDWLAT